MTLEMPIQICPQFSKAPACKRETIDSSGEISLSLHVTNKKDTLRLQVGAARLMCM
jgi:hypothetical protein